jgi:YwiC-like protein
VTRMATSSTMTPTDRPSARARRRPVVPPQHGAWAYLALPLLLGLTIAGWTWLGVLFALTWIAAYPVSYYGARALVVRVRRGSWSRIAVRERDSALPWAVGCGAGALVLAVARHWLVPVGLGLAVLWFAGVRLALAGRERGFANDLLLLGQALIALPLVWLVSDGAPVSGDIWFATAVCAAYFVGSVIHVKSLIRESDDPRWHRADLGYHIGALATALLSPWLLRASVPALVRSVLLRPTAQPAVIGMVEMLISVLVIIATLAALR